MLRFWNHSLLTAKSLTVDASDPEHFNGMVMCKVACVNSILDVSLYMYSRKDKHSPKNKKDKYQILTLEFCSFAEACKMTSLQELHLDGNYFFGKLPPCIRNLTSLGVLDLSYNLLKVRFPTSNFGNMSSLLHLSLSHNQLEGMLHLSSFSRYIRLRYLGLSSNSTNFQVQTESPAANISIQLQVLEMSNCNLNGNSGVVPSLLLHQHELYIIDLSNNYLNGHSPAWLIENNTNLSYLNLRKNSFVGPLILPSKVTTKLSWLDASCNMLSKEIPEVINITLPNLYYINLSRNSFEGTHPSPFGYMEKLSHLDISYNNISDDIAACFSGPHPSLTALFVSGNSFHAWFTP